MHINLLFFRFWQTEIVFKYGEVTLNLNLPLKSVTLENIRSLVMEIWNEFYRKEFHLECEVATGIVKTVDDDTLRDLLLSSTRLIFTVVSDCIGFSEYKNEIEYLASERIRLEGYHEFPKSEIDLEQWRDQIDHAVRDIRNKMMLYGPFSETCEASVREFVSPVLSLSAIIAGDIMMRAEQNIWGLRGNGPSDYLCLYKKFPIVVTQVKDENVQNGYAQNYAQLVASRQEYKYMLPALLVGDKDIKIYSKKRKYLDID